MSSSSSKAASKQGRGTLNASPALFRGEHTVRWFRLYSETIDDPKVQRLPDHLFKTWINLLCLTSRNNGVLPCEPDIAFALRLTHDAVSQQLNELIIAGLLDETKAGLVPHNWNGRQYKSDVSTERVKRFRKQERNVSVTAPDTDTEADTEKKNPSASAKPRGAQNQTQVTRTQGESRHSRTQQLVMGWYLDWAGVECPWDGSEAKQLSGLLKAWPGASDSQLMACLENVARSDCIAKGDRPREWLGRLPKFIKGPLDQFKNPKQAGKNGNGNHKTTDAGRANRNIQALVLSGMGAGVQRNDVPDGAAVQHRVAGGSAGNRGASPIAASEILERKP